MILKKMFFALFAFYVLTQPFSIFCMMEESFEEEETSKKAIPKPTLIDPWSKYFNENETFEKSFVFDTRDFEKMIAIQTDTKTHFFHFVDGMFLKLHTLSDKFFDNVERYIPTVYQEDGNYIFYVAKKKSALVFNEKYVVEKLAFRQGQAEIIRPRTLFEHNTPIMYLGELENGKYLVAGSFYPSIKIYDCKKGKVIKTLHNRFLLGAYDDTLYFAKKVEPRPYFGLGRLLDYELNKQYKCTLHSLTQFYNNPESIPVENVYIMIDYNNYPFLIRSSEGFIFDRNNTIIDFNGNKQFDLSQLSMKEIERGNEITFKKGDVNEKVNKIIELFQDNNFLKIFKERITYDSFISFGNTYKKEYIVQSYFLSIIKPMVEKIIRSDSQLCSQVAHAIVGDLMGILNQLVPGGSNSIIFNKESFNSLEKAVANKDFKIRESFWTKIKTDFIQNTSIYQPKYILQEKMQNIHMNNQYIIVQRKNDIFGADWTGPRVIFEKWYTSENEIENTYIMDNTVFIIKKDGLYQLEISRQSITIQQKPLPQKLEEELYPSYKINAVKYIINTLRSPLNVQNLKNLFKNTNTFPIDAHVDIPDIQGYPGDTSITPIVRDGYLRPILRKWIFEIAKQYNTVFENDELQQLVQVLANKINNLEMWIHGLKVEDIFTKINKDFLSTAEVKDKPELLKKILGRFEKLNLASDNTDIYKQNLGSLSLCYGMETVKFEIGGKNQTYLVYARDHFVEVADKIKSLEIDARGVLQEVIFGQKKK